MHKNYFLIACLFTIETCLAKAQSVVFWTEDFNNACTSNCIADGYISVNGTWVVSQTGTNGNVANEWFISCSENGETTGACGAGCGNNATLHVGSVPCTLCLACPNGDCGATYNAGPILLGENPTTDKRTASPSVNTIGKTDITLSFRYIENGQGTNDDATIEYSIDNGVTWLLLDNPAKTAVCANGQGTWTDYSYTLPATCENISTLKIGFRWKNNGNSGTDPSFAVDDVVLSFFSPNSILQLESGSTFELNYDNKTNDLILVTGNTSSNNSKPAIFLCDAVGRVVLKINPFLTANTTQRFSLENLPHGIYIASLRIEGKTLSRKINK